MRKIKVLGLALLCGALALGITKPAKAVSEAVTLSATPNPAKNSISLQWNSSDSSQKYSYVLYSKSDKDKEFQSIPAKDSIKVLNVYPDSTSGVFQVTGTATFHSTFYNKDYTVPTSAALKMWMEAANSECGQGYGKGHISVDAVSITAFNLNPWDTLHNPDGTYKYDEVYFGAWDGNGGEDINSNAESIMEGYLNKGYGVLLGHDTPIAALGFLHTNFCTLAEKYLNMYTDKFGYYGAFANNRGGTQIGIMRKGLLTSYPWPIGDVGTILTVPQSHVEDQFAMGDVWLNYSGVSSVTSYNGKTGTDNFYLTSWNNMAMIQAGHSCGQATPDEQKILANTLFYLGQITSDTSWNDHKGQDLAAPDKPVITSVTPNSDPSRYTVNYSASKDNGTNYQYYVEATGQSDGRKYTSTTVPAKITSGIAGYKMIADHSPDTVVSGTADTASTSCSFSRPDGPTFYVHVAAVDNAGNASETATYFINESISVTHPSSITYKIDPDNDTPFMSAEIPITNNSTIPVKVFVQGVSNATGGTLTLNNVPSFKYPDWSKLTVAQTKADAAFSVRIKEASTGPGTWLSISQGGTVNTSSMSKTLMGTISAKGTGTLILTADCGLAWDRQYTALQNLSLVFES